MAKHYQPHLDSQRIDTCDAQARTGDVCGRVGGVVGRGVTGRGRVSEKRSVMNQSLQPLVPATRPNRFLTLFSALICVMLLGCASQQAPRGVGDARYIEDLFSSPVASQSFGGHISPRNEIRADLDRDAVMRELRLFIREDPSALLSRQGLGGQQNPQGMRPIDYWACVYAHLHDEDAFIIGLHWSDQVKDDEIHRLLDKYP